jgi:hypothetical protein
LVGAEGKPSKPQKGRVGNWGKSFLTPGFLQPKIYSGRRNCVNAFVCHLLNAQPMNDKRFLSVLNQVAATMAPAPLEPSSGRSEAEAIGLWAEFLKRCVEKGVSVGDPRWRVLEAHRVGGKPRFRLPSTEQSPEETRDDFSVGLALLMGVLHPDGGRES